MFFVYGFVIIVLGLMFGSFGSVLLSRLEEKHDRETIKSILIGRSKCPKCKKTLQAKELIPLVSYLRQKGKCSHCKTNISKEYPILELVCWWVFWITYMSLYSIHSNFWLYGIENLIFWLGTNWILTLLIIHDIKSFELHMPLRIMGMIRVRWREITFWIYKEALIWAGISLCLFMIIYLFGKRYVKRRFDSEEEWFWQWDVYIGLLLWSLFPMVWSIQGIWINRISSVKMTMIMIVLASMLGILYFLGEFLFTKKTWRKSKELDIFTERKETNKIIPFIPALICAFRILLYKADVILSFVF